MGSAAKWLQEERRRVLGDWAGFCVECGAVRRWFERFEAEVPTECPACGGTFLHRCPTCDAPFSSAFAVECEVCGSALRASRLFGTRIRRE